MLRAVMLVLAIAFTAAMLGFTVLDIVRYGITVPSVLGLFVVGLFSTGLIGALWQMPPRE